jgi:hypothetical protein
VDKFVQPRAKCNACDFECNNSVRRCEEHFIVCLNVDITTLQEYFGQSFERPSNTGPRHLTKRPINKLVTRPNSNINSFLDRVTTTEQEELENLFAQAIFRCGFPLSLSELELITQLFKKLRPSFKSPQRKKLSTTLLNKVYDETKLEVEKLINNAEYICIITDGWMVCTNDNFLK